MVYLVGTMHNRRGDPLSLERLLHHLVKCGEVKRISLTWSVPSGDLNPSQEEIKDEIHALQKTMRACVSIVNASRLSRECHAILGRAFRSFQYEVTTTVNNVKRHFPHVEVFFVDLPKARWMRWREIGDQMSLHALAQIPAQDQSKELLGDYELFGKAYEDLDTYANLIAGPKFPPLQEFNPALSGLAEEREAYIAKSLGEVRSDLHITRFAHLIRPQPESLTKLKVVPKRSLVERIADLEPSVITLDRVDVITGTPQD